MKSIFRFFITLAAIVWFTGAKAQTMETTKTPPKVVIQLSNSDTLVHKSLVKQLNNLRNAMDSIVIEVVILGPGIEMVLKDAPFENSLKTLNDQGVRFLVCRNTMKEKRVLPGQLSSFVQVIPAGIAHMIVRQGEGWSYIKAGF